MPLTLSAPTNSSEDLANFPISLMLASSEKKSCASSTCAERVRGGSGGERAQGREADERRKGLRLGVIAELAGNDGAAERPQRRVRVDLLVIQQLAEHCLHRAVVQPLDPVNSPGRALVDECVVKEQHLECVGQLLSTHVLTVGDLLEDLEELGGGGGLPQARKKWVLLLLLLLLGLLLLRDSEPGAD